MVTAESLCCGTPVVGFKAGAPEQISIPEYSSFVDFGDLDSLREEVKGKISSNILIEKIVLEASKKYSKKKMVVDYVGIYNEL